MTSDRTDGGGGMSDQKVLCDYFNKRLPGIRCGMTEEQHRLFPMTGHDFTPQPTPPTDEALRALAELYKKADRHIQVAHAAPEAARAAADAFADGYAKAVLDLDLILALAASETVRGPR